MPFFIQSTTSNVLSALAVRAGNYYNPTDSRYSRKEFAVDIEPLLPPKQITFIPQQDSNNQHPITVIVCPASINLPGQIEIGRTRSGQAQDSRVASCLWPHRRRKEKTGQLPLLCWNARNLISGVPLANECT